MFDDIDTAFGSNADRDTELLRRCAAAPPLVPPRAFRSPERFLLGRRLGEGGFGIVYEAHDQESGARVALKALRCATAEGLSRFQREFFTLKELAHPNIVRVYELARSVDDWFFTMEIIDGEPFLDQVVRKPKSLILGFAQLARGIEALHAAGIIHCDLKPTNMLVAADGRVVLFDFGLAVRPRFERELVMAGTPLYMAPEQATGTMGPASDWYAFGVILYQALTGTTPFKGSTSEILSAKLNRDPLPPRAHRPDAPPPLDRLCTALLSRDPMDRPGSEAVLAALELAERQVACAVESSPVAASDAA
jgi:eukaryotic-like serine/threonine-protein kinase